MKRWIVLSRTALWPSTRLMSEAWLKEYRVLDPDAIEVEIKNPYPLSGIVSGGPQVDEILRRFRHDRPDEVIFLTHLPNPFEWIQLMDSISHGSTRFRIHAYGDFIQHLCSHPQNTQLNQIRFQFLTASHRHRDLIRNCFSNGDELVEATPPNLQLDRRWFDPIARKKVRKQFSISAHDSVLIYTGRISPQKHVPDLIDAFQKLSETNRHLHLMLIGDFDDTEGGVFAFQRPLGSSFQEVMARIQSLKQPERSRLHLIRSVPNAKLREYLSAADLFVSLSRFHDEEFGVAPLEALASGLEVVVTNWGGYSDLSDFAEFAALVSVQATDHGPSLRKHELIAKLKEARHRVQLDERQRVARQRSILAKFQERAAQQTLLRSLSKPAVSMVAMSSAFQNFVEFMQKDASRARPQASASYRRLYRPYYQKAAEKT